MKNKKICIYLRIVFVLVFLCLFNHTAHASNSIVINEIMYDAQGGDTDHEWIEIHNISDSTIDLTKYRYNDGVSPSNHIFNNPPEFPAGAYAILVDNPANFISANPSFSGLLLVDTVLTSLNNSGGTLSILDCSSAPCVSIDTVTYTSSQGASGDGNSIQRTQGNTWISAVPTPGLENINTTSSSDNTTDTSSSNNSTNTTSTSSTVSSSVIIQPVLYTQANISVPRNAFVGVNIPISVSVIGDTGDNRQYGDFRFTLGDGTEYEDNSPASFEHIYQFPGTYVVYFEYRSNRYKKEPDAISRAMIDVSLSGVNISAIKSDSSVEITNFGNREQDISNWSIQKMTPEPVYPTFQIPKGTIILPNKKIILTSKMTGFEIPTYGGAALLLPGGEISMVYDNTPVPKEDTFAVSLDTEKTPELKTKSTQTSFSKKIKSTAVTAEALKSLEPITKNSLEKDATKNSNNFPLFIVVSVSIIAGIILSIRYFNIFSVYKKGNTEVEEPKIEEDTKSIADSIRILEE